MYPKESATNHLLFCGKSTDIQIAIRGGTQDEVAPEDVEVEIVQHPDIGNEVEITNTDHKTAAQLTARIQNGSDYFIIWNCAG